ncbi:isochorismate synthase 2, partial [Perilla frutescens var. hirtella]
MAVEIPMKVSGLIGNFQQNPVALVQVKLKDVEVKFKGWLAKQTLPVEAVIVTATSAIQGAANLNPDAMASLKQAQALAGGPLLQALNFAVMTGANAGIACVMKRLRGKDDVQSKYGIAGTMPTLYLHSIGAAIHEQNKVEFNEFEGSSMIAATVAWDNRLSRTYGEAIAALEATMWQVSSLVQRLNGSTRRAVTMLHQTHVPNKASWDSVVKQALDLIKTKNSSLIKVVLAHSSRVLTTVEIDPMEWLTSLQVERVNSYQFCLQPLESPAFIGNTLDDHFSRPLKEFVSLCLKKNPAE